MSTTNPFENVLSKDNYLTPVSADGHHFTRYFESQTNTKRVQREDGKFNFLRYTHHGSELLSDKWWHDAEDFSLLKKFVIVGNVYRGDLGCNNYYVYITKDNIMSIGGRLLFNQPMDIIIRCEENPNMFIVNKDDKFNILTEDHEFLLKEPCDYIGQFHEGLALVKMNGKYNYMREDGSLLLEGYVLDCAQKKFRRGLSFVKINNTHNILTTEGKFLLPEKVDDIKISEDYKSIIVKKDGKRTTIKLHGRGIPRFWFSRIERQCDIPKEWPED